MEEVTYTFAGAAKILDIAESKLRYWAQVGFVGPSARRAGKQMFTFQDLVSIKAAKELTDRGFRAAEIRKALDHVRASLPEVDRPLDRIRVAFDGSRLVVVDDGSAFETSGQRVFDFNLGDLARRSQGGTGGAAAVAPAEPVPAPLPATPSRALAAEPGREPSAYEWFVEGTHVEMRGGDGAEARSEACYRKALEIDPGLAAAHTNLGNLAHRRGDGAQARAAFEAALALDPDQPEARFNLANLILESGDLELAVAEFRRVLQADPGFADAHYNLAVALERLGGRAQARAHLERYLALEERTAPWAAEARALIERLS
jgi:DNA-binding transcriptional MerR regulator/cytochrome c-type biogenesis protein CcmH/NrfG